MASVKNSWIRKYGEEEGLKMWEERKKLSATTKDTFIRKYGEVDGVLKWNEYREKIKKRGLLSWYVEKYGEVLGELKYKEKNSKLSVGKNTLLNNGFSLEEIKNIREKHSKNSKITLENLIKKYGNIVGEQKWKNFIIKSKISSKRSLEYWLKINNGDIKKSKSDLKEYQCRDINFYIKKYGLIDGTENFKIKEKLRLKNLSTSKFQIEIEEFVSTLYKNINGHKNEYSFYLKNEERNKLNQNIIIPDIVIKDLNLIIECFGDFWHCSSDFNDEYLHPIIKKTAYEIRERDRIRFEIIKQRGYDFIIIWESEWNKNKNNIKKIIEDEINKKRS